MPDESPTRYIETRHGARVAYTVTGRGERVLLLANGLGGRLYTWQPLVDAFADDYRIITWDYRGLFDSTPPTRHAHLSITDHADDAIAILDAEGVSRAVFCGWSMGVQVTLEAASMYPERVAGMLLMNGTYGHVFSSGLQPFMRFPFAGAWLNAVVETVADRPQLARAIEYGAPRAVMPAAALFWLVSRARPAQMTPMMERYMREVFDPRTFPNYLRLFQELDAHSVLHHLRDIHVPALVVSGAWDWLTPPYQSHVIARRLPDAEAIHLRRASHFVLLERPEVVVPAARRFLKQRARW
ncbi:MAG: alpha/beta hydrolase [Deltaproteobacteria bacterium]|nr:alpha/beta hydrolase [Myxococcales bacterium]MDP3216565.1 alpha/beta hydrolase [Deltaproteobacteria bacterium]